MRIRPWCIINLCEITAMDTGPLMLVFLRQAIRSFIVQKVSAAGKKIAVTATSLWCALPIWEAVPISSCAWTLAAHRNNMLLAVFIASDTFETYWPGGAISRSLRMNRAILQSNEWETFSARVISLIVTEPCIICTSTRSTPCSEKAGNNIFLQTEYSGRLPESSHIIQDPLNARCMRVDIGCLWCPWGVRTSRIRTWLLKVAPMKNDAYCLWGMHRDTCRVGGRHGKQQYVNLWRSAG